MAASPIPMPMRAATSAVIDSAAAGGVSSVNADHASTASPSTRLPP